MYLYKQFTSFHKKIRIRRHVLDIGPDIFVLGNNLTGQKLIIPGYISLTRVNPLLALITALIQQVMGFTKF